MAVRGARTSAEARRIAANIAKLPDYPAHTAKLISRRRQTPHACVTEYRKGCWSAASACGLLRRGNGAEQIGDDSEEDRERNSDGRAAGLGE
jgi:hypothetical protein